MGWSFPSIFKLGCFITLLLLIHICSTCTAETIVNGTIHTFPITIVDKNLYFDASLLFYDEDFSDEYFNQIENNTFLLQFQVDSTFIQPTYPSHTVIQLYNNIYPQKPYSDPQILPFSTPQKDQNNTSVNIPINTPIVNQSLAFTGFIAFNSTLISSYQEQKYQPCENASLPNAVFLGNLITQVIFSNVSSHSSPLFTTTTPICGFIDTPAASVFPFSPDFLLPQSSPDQHIVHLSHITSSPCDIPHANPTQCPDFFMIQTPAGNNNFQHNFRAFIPMLSSSFRAIDVVLFGVPHFPSFYGCKIDGIPANTTTTASPLPGQLSFHLEIPSTMQPDQNNGDTVSYLSVNSSVDILCLFMTQSLPIESISGVHLTFQPLDHDDSNIYVMTMISPRLLPLDDTYHWVITPNRPIVTSSSSSSSTSSSSSSSSSSSLSSSSPSSATTTTATTTATSQHTLSTDIQPINSFQYQMKCSWFISASNTPFTTASFAASMQISLWDFPFEIDSAHITLYAPQTDNGALEHTDLLVAMQSSLEFVESSSHISLSQPVNITIDNDIPSNSSQLALIHVVLTSYQLNFRDQATNPLTVSSSQWETTPKCGLIYSQPYQYTSPYLSPTEQPVRFESTQNKTSWYIHNNNSTLLPSSSWQQVPITYLQAPKPSHELLTAPGQFQAFLTFEGSLTSPLSIDPIDMFSFNFMIYPLNLTTRIKWVQYSIPNQELRFEGNFSIPCIRHDGIPFLPLSIVLHQPFTDIAWTQSFVFDMWYIPNTFYHFTCPGLRLVTSNLNQISFDYNNRNLLPLDRSDNASYRANDAIIEKQIIISILGTTQDTFPTSSTPYWYGTTILVPAQIERHFDRIKTVVICIVILSCALLIAMFGLCSYHTSIGTNNTTSSMISVNDSDHHGDTSDSSLQSDDDDDNDDSNETRLL